jgi:hypothetical protein
MLVLRRPARPDKHEEANGPGRVVSHHGSVPTPEEAHHALLDLEGTS